MAIIVGIPSALAALIAVGATLRRMLSRNGATDDEHGLDTAETTGQLSDGESRYDVDIEGSQGVVIGHNPKVTMQFVSEAGARSQVNYWAGRPESLGDRFYGREDELGATASSLAGGRAVVTSGGAGSGKSRLAAEHAHRAKVDGFWTAAGADLASTLAGLAPELGSVSWGRATTRSPERCSEGLPANLPRRCG